MNKRSLSYTVPFIAGLAMAIGLWIGQMLDKEAPATESMGQSRYQKIQDIIQILDRRYVDEVDSEEIFEKAIADMLHNLDPHSNYIPAKDLKAINEDIIGKFGGIGIRFFVIRDTVCVTNVIKGSPSDLAGLKAGDRILRVDGESIVGKKITNDEIMSKLKGNEGSPVKVQILRKKKKFDKTLIRGTIPVESILSSYMLDDKTGYIKIERFSVETAREFRQASKELRDMGMTQMILDLRNNGGGVLTTATEIADEFLRANVPIVETRGEHAGVQVYRASSRGILHDTKVAILINSNSASASEILAGAIQDNDRGVIVGRRSFGKGLVQEDVLLRDGSNLRLTIARYYTPTGRCIQKPYSGDIDEYYDQMERYENGELYHVDSASFNDSLKYKTPKGKIVYGGGGIFPDVFVPLDTTGASWYLTHLRYSPAFTTFAFDFVSDKRSKWTSIAQFNKEFTVSDKILKDFTEYAKRHHKVSFSATDLLKSRQTIKNDLKAEIARQLWVEEGYYQVQNTIDKEIREALKALK
jgi:carboxyl-terminal processing protease